MNGAGGMGQKGSLAGCRVKGGWRGLIARHWVPGSRATESAAGPAESC